MSHLLSDPASVAAVRLALLGGEGLRPETAPLWQRLLVDSARRSPVVAVVPPVFGKQPLGHAERRTRMAVEALAGLGARVITLDNGVDTIGALHAADAIFMPGGEPRVMVAYLAGSGLWQAIRMRLADGMQLIASGGATTALSAWAFAPLQPISRALDEQAYELIPGLGLLAETAIFPYFSWLQGSLLDRLIGLMPPGTTLIGIDDQAALLACPGYWEAAGVGTITLLHAGSAAQVFDPGDRIGPAVLPSFDQVFGTP